MKKFVVIICAVFILCLGISGGEVRAQAANTSNQPYVDPLPFQNTQIDTPTFDNSVQDPNNFKNNYSQTLTQQSTTDKATTDKAAQEATNTTNNRLTSFALAPVKMATLIVRAILTICLSVMNLALTTIGLLFEVVIRITVLQMKNFVDAINIIPVIHKSIRDFVNMFFIFFLIFESIKLIVGYSDTKKIRTMLIHLIVASLIMNFSLFITKAIIDVSNIAAVGFFQQLPSTKYSDSVALGSNANVGLGGAIMNVLKVTSIYATSNIGDDVKFIVGAIGGIVVMVILIFFFFVATFIFVRRFLVLLVLMIFSPMMVAGWVFPPLKKQSDEWWAALSEHCMLAPVFMMLVWVAFKIIQDPGFAKIIQTSNGLNNAGLFSAFTNPTLDSVLIFVNFGIVIGLLTMAVLNAASMGEHGKAAVAWGKSKMGWIGAQTAGRLGSKLEEKYADTAGGNSATGRAVRALSTGLMANSKYYGTKSFGDLEKEDKDLSKKIKAQDRNIKIKAGFDAAVNSGDSAAISDALKKYSNKEVAELGPKTIMKPEVFAALSDEHFEEILKSEKFSEEDKLKVRDERNKDLNAALEAKDKNAVANALKRMSNKQIEKLDNSTIRNKTFALGISSSQFQDLLKSKDMNQDTKDTLKENRLQNITAALAQAVGAVRTAAVQQAVSELKMNATEVSKLPKQVLVDKDIIKTFTKDTLSTLIKENVDSNTRSEIKDKVTAMLNDHRSQRQILDQATLDKVNKLNDWITNTPAGQEF